MPPPAVSEDMFAHLQPQGTSGHAPAPLSGKRDDCLGSTGTPLPEAPPRRQKGRGRGRGRAASMPPPVAAAGSFSIAGDDRPVGGSGVQCAGTRGDAPEAPSGRRGDGASGSDTPNPGESSRRPKGRGRGRGCGRAASMPPPGAAGDEEPVVDLTSQASQRVAQGSGAALGATQRRWSLGPRSHGSASVTASRNCDLLQSLRAPSRPTPLGTGLGQPRGQKKLCEMPSISRGTPAPSSMQAPLVQATVVKPRPVGRLFGRDASTTSAPADKGVSIGEHSGAGGGRLEGVAAESPAVGTGYLERLLAHQQKRAVSSGGAVSVPDRTAALLPDRPEPAPHPAKRSRRRRIADDDDDDDDDRPVMFLTGKVL